MPTYLNCPFKDKEIVKSLGARWDAKNKSWYVLDGEDLSKFKKWLNEKAGGPAGASNNGSNESKTKKVTNSYDKDVKNKQTSHVDGASVVEFELSEAYRQYVCSCKVLAWEVCEHSAAYESHISKVMNSKVMKSFT